MANGTSVTSQLQSFMRGDTPACEDLIAEILPKLRQIAQRTLNRERYAAPFSQTELIHELWIGSLAKGRWRIHDQSHFYALASLAMRRILTDFARKRLALKRGGPGAFSIPQPAGYNGPALHHTEQIAAIGILMGRMEVEDPEAARVVDMHYFSGFTLEEVARQTGMSLKQVRVRWERGLKWLKSKLHAKINWVGKLEDA